MTPKITSTGAHSSRHDPVGRDGELPLSFLRRTGLTR
jgi:hypothetical protein